MQAPNPLVGVGVPPPRPPLRIENYTLSIRQQPERAKVVVRGKEKDRKPIDPPPIVQLRVYDEYEAQSNISFLHNPYFFCCCELYEANRDQPKAPESGAPLLLSGSIVSSLHRLKDLDNSEGGYFVFGDLSAGVQGRFRLHFSLYEYRPHENQVVYHKSATSNAFEVASPKDWDGVKESTILSRSFADQGVRLRLRKESRNAAAKRPYMPQPSGSSANPQTPIRPLPSQTGSFGSHSSQEAGGQGEPSFKRQRSYPSSTMSMGFPAQGSTSSSGFQQSGQNQGPQSNFTPMSAQTGAAQAYPSMASGGYGQQFQFGASQYGNFAQNPYSYPVSGSNYRQQQAHDPSTFMSPFTSPNTQLPPQTSQQAQQPQQQPYPSQMSTSGYSYSNPSYAAYGSGSAAYPAPSSFAPQSSQQQTQSAYSYHQPGQQQAPYGSQSSMRGSVLNRPMANPMSTPHLPPIKRPGSESGEGDQHTQIQRGQQGYPPPGSSNQGGYAG